MQRMITLDSVIYVHENPKRRRRPIYVEPELVAEPESEEPHGDYAEPSADWSPEPVVVAEAGVEEQVVLAAAEVESESEFESESESDPEPEAVHVSHAPAAWPAAVAAEPEPEPVPTERPGRKTRTIVRSAQVAPPPGYAIEFGTGRLVKIHSYRGRMSYPSSGN